MPEKTKKKIQSKIEGPEKKRKGTIKKKLFFIFPPVVAIVIAVVLIFSGRTQSSVTVNFFGQEVTSSTMSANIDCPKKSFFDGRCLSDSESLQPAVVGIMIEDYLEAQPLSGVSQASVVYEAPVEGNIPRFLALYAVGDTVNEVGPVRSARPYYLDWLSEYGDAMYMHVGGSNDALEKIKTYNIFDVNEFYNGPRFWRSKERFAPHNTYTSSELWQKAYADFSQKRTPTSYTSWNFSGQKECDASSTFCVQKISFSYVPGVYEVEWKYNAEKKAYERYQNGVLHKDKDGQPMIAHTIIVQHADMDILDDVGRRGIDTVGKEGIAEVYVLGNKISGTWKKQTRQSRTEWLDENGQSIPLASEKIWVEVVPTGIVVNN